MEFEFYPEAKNSLGGGAMTLHLRTRLFEKHAGQPMLHITDSEILTVRKSLRLHPEDHVACFNGDGMEYIYQIEEVTSSQILMQYVESMPNPRDPEFELQVWIASTKGKTKDRMVRDLTPLGVTRILFYKADRSVSSPHPKIQTRLHRIAIESCRQCGRSTIPDIVVSGDSLPPLIQNRSSKRLYVFWEKAVHSPSAIPVDTHSMDHASPLILVFGPEGGFSEEESSLIRENNIPTLSLGQRILRSELAVVVGVTRMQILRNEIP